jgi:adsorption protein B
MGAFDLFLWVIDRATHELALFAAVGILIGGIDDLVVDLIWFLRDGWRRIFVYSRHDRFAAADLAAPAYPGLIAIFVPAWREAAVIGPMLATAIERFGAADYRIYVGCYPNDPATIDAVRRVTAHSARVRLVVGTANGPTTKADNLNAIWDALMLDERSEGRVAKAIVLHDAEDVVHPSEIRIFDRLIERFDLVQLPVLPLIERGKGWWARAISTHYADEFAEAHGKQLVVREALGAAMPSAGVGCAFSRRALGRIAAQSDGRPFDGASMTEDYELGLRITESGGRGVFVRLPGRRGGSAVAVRAHFPDTLDAAIRQKSRWLTGIALSGWDRLGWRGGLAERWMRMRDRRAVLAALVLFAAYVAMIGWGLVLLLAPLSGHEPIAFGPVELLLFQVNLAILAWRLLMRCTFVAHAYGVREGLRAIPRAVLANIISMIAARRALARYVQTARGGPTYWDKTDHVFPASVPAE